MSELPNEREFGSESKHQCYYRKNNVQCKEKAKLRMQKLRAQRKEMAILNAETLERRKQQAESSTYIGESDSDDSITLTPSANLFVFHDEYFGLDHTFELDAFQPPLPEKEKSVPRRVPTPSTSFGEFIGPPEPKADDTDDTNTDTTTHYQKFQEICVDVNIWSRAFGGLEQWPSQLNCTYHAAVESNNVEGWLSDVWGHAAEGRKILNQLRNMEGQLPYEMWKIREMWRLEVELVELVVCGILCLELRSSLVGTGQLNLVTGV
ncbi:hypothetical protein BDZ94DRAFT_1271693 [Collybia nuda]|uniref:Uncharacterized protein n=1 Tax=Collybia nuda TaxID=64659 RepID=A0A9P5XYL7_9AGAR|nr:hypothetical protein BDZ94DRAFT_1271693 [Collybia nuda]